MVIKSNQQKEQKKQEKELKRKQEQSKFSEIDGELKELTLKNFKQFEKAVFKDFGKINIFFGNNNCGKSTILEAILYSTNISKI